MAERIWFRFVAEWHAFVAGWWVLLPPRLGKWVVVMGWDRRGAKIVAAVPTGDGACRIWWERG